MKVDQKRESGKYIETVFSYQKSFGKGLRNSLNFSVYHKS